MRVEKKKKKKMEEIRSWPRLYKIQYIGLSQVVHAGVVTHKISPGLFVQCGYPCEERYIYTYFVFEGPMFEELQ